MCTWPAGSISVYFLYYLSESLILHEYKSVCVNAYTKRTAQLSICWRLAYRESADLFCLFTLIWATTSMLRSFLEHVYFCAPFHRPVFLQIRTSFASYFTHRRRSRCCQRSNEVGEWNVQHCEQIMAKFTKWRCSCCDSTFSGIHL